MRRLVVGIALLFAIVVGWIFLRTGPGAPRPQAGPPPRAGAPEALRAAEARVEPEPAVAASTAAREAPAPRRPRAAARANSTPISTATATGTSTSTSTSTATSTARSNRTADAAAAAAAAIAAAEAALGAEGPEAPVHSGAITGAVRDARGAPLPYVTVLAVAPDGADGNETFSDDDGEFVVPGLRPGRYAVFAGLGTPLASRIGARSVTVKPAMVSLVDLREPADAAPVRIEALDADGQVVDGEPVLIAGRPGEGGAFGSVLAGDAIFLPERGARPASLRVPPGIYTLVVLQGPGQPARAARDPIRVTGAPLDVSVRVRGPVARR